MPRTRHRTIIPMGQFYWPRSPRPETAGMKKKSIYHLSSLGKELSGKSRLSAAVQTLTYITIIARAYNIFCFLFFSKPWAPEHTQSGLGFLKRIEKHALFTRFSRLEKIFQRNPVYLRFATSFHRRISPHVILPFLSNRESEKYSCGIIFIHFADPGNFISLEIFFDRFFFFIETNNNSMYSSACGVIHDPRIKLWALWP